MQFPEPWGAPIWRQGGTGGCWGDERPLHSGAWKLNDFMSQGRPLLKFHRSCSGPTGGGVWAIRTVWDNAAAGGHGRSAAGLGWEWPRRCPLHGALWWLQETGFVENCFSAWNETSSRWLGPCPCVGHYHTKTPIKILKNKKLLEVVANDAFTVCRIVKGV